MLVIMAPGAEPRWRAALSVGRVPMPGQELTDAVYRMVGDAREHVAQVSFGVEAVELGGLDQGIHRGRPDPTQIGAGKEIILAPQSKRSDCSLGGIVADLQSAVGGIACQRSPARERVTDRTRE